MTDLITIDVDWAPDWIIDDLANRLLRYGVKATWFVTHGSPALERLRAHPDLFELGMHPNFLPASTHGRTDQDVLRHMQDLVPDAVSCRTHGAFMSGRLLGELRARTNVRIDSSFLLYGHEPCQPFPVWTPHGVIWRMPYAFADDHEFLRPQRDWRIAPLTGGARHRVFLFHPIHVALNASDVAPYLRLRARFPNLQDAPRSAVAEEAGNGLGARTMFDTLVDALGASGGSLLMRSLIADPDTSPGHDSRV